MSLDIQELGPVLREELRRDATQGMARLAATASKYANNRKIAYDAVLLSRALSISGNPPSSEQMSQSIALLDALIADQATAASSGAETHHTIAESTRSRTLAVPVPKGIVFECENLGKSYGRGNFRLEKISIDIRYGEIAGIVGRNGNGKTTLFRLVVGELRPTAGSLRFPGIQPDYRSIQWSRVRPQIAYLQQELPVWHGPLKSNLHYEAAIHGILGPENEHEVEYIVERLGLGDHLQRRWHELSGGYKLRFALARALVWKPKLLVLDEPLANLDFVAQQVVLNDLRHLADSLRYPLAVLVSSQHLHEIEEVSDKLLVLSSGRMRYFGPVQDIGEHRDVNRFELAGNIEIHDLQAAFSGSEYHSIYYSGIAFVLTTSISVTPQTVFQRLIEAKLPIDYFRDISRSAKSLVESDAPGN